MTNPRHGLQQKIPLPGIVCNKCWLLEVFDLIQPGELNADLTHKGLMIYSGGIPSVLELDESCGSMEGGWVRQYRCTFVVMGSLADTVESLSSKGHGNNPISHSCQCQFVHFNCRHSSHIHSPNSPFPYQREKYLDAGKYDFYVADYKMLSQS